MFQYRTVLRLGAAAVCSLAVASCVTPAEQQKKLEVMMPPAITAVAHYSSCYQPISQLRATYQATYQQTINAVTAEGARRGARIGARRGGINLVGLFVGAMVAGLEADAIATKQLVDNTVSTARAARACYDREFASLMTRVRSKKIKRGEAQARLKEIEQGYEETAMMLGEVVTAANQRQDQLNSALTERGAKPRTTTTASAASKPTTTASASAKTTPPTTTTAASSQDAETAVLAESSAGLKESQNSASAELISNEEQKRQVQNALLGIDLPS